MAVTALFGTARRAAADTAIDSRRSDTYYAIHGSAGGVLLIGAATLSTLVLVESGRMDWDWFPLDLHVRGNFSEAAAQLSDMTLAITGAAPVFAHAGLGIDRGFSNAGMAYAEAVGAELMLASLTKLAVARPRPYMHRNDPHIVRYRKQKLRESYASFFSGHAGFTFVSAIAGSYLYSQRSPDVWARRVMWGSTTLLASTTASLRVVAGRHYLSDVLAGALIGSSLGVAIPWLHGYRAPDAELGSDLAFGLGGFGAGVAVGIGTGLLGVLADPSADPLPGGLALSVTTLGDAPALNVAGAWD